MSRGLGTWLAKYLICCDGLHDYPSDEVGTPCNVCGHKRTAQYMTGLTSWLGGTFTATKKPPP